MSEFKFACPVCGQHITADSNNFGAQLECPTCFRKIIVPRAPAVESSKFVLSAAEASRPKRPGATPPPPPPEPPKPARSNKTALFLVLGVVVIGGAVAAVFHFKKDFFTPPPTTEKIETNQPVAVAESNPPAPALVAWKLDLTNAVIPEANATGKLHDRDFNNDRATLLGGSLALRQGAAWPPELGVSVSTFAKLGEELSGQTIQITTNSPRGPRIILRWKDGAQASTESFTNGYAMKLEFGQAANGRIPGKIYLCTPDDAKSWVAGTFDAEIRKPTPPKPRPTNPQQRSPRLPLRPAPR